jgi:hypothetical protein
MNSSYHFFLFLSLLSPIFASCQSQTTSPPVEALVSYLHALVDKDEAMLTVLSCPEWEVDALFELDAFQSVETRLVGLQCQLNAIDSNSATVTCQGKILTSYNGEQQEYDLGDRTYSIVEQGGDWLVCGY